MLQEPSHAPAAPTHPENPSQNGAPPSADGSADGSPSPGAHPKPRRLGLVPLTKDLKIPPRDWLVEGLWQRQAVGFFGGPPKAGKNWLALDFSVSVATGTPFLGWSVPESGPVLYFLGEEFLGDVCERVDRLLNHRGMTRDDLKGRLLFTEIPPCLEDTNSRIELGLAASEEKPLLIIFDPLERFLGSGDANATKDMRSVNGFFRETLSRANGTSVCVVHHTDKKGKGLRGTGDFRAISEATLLFGEANNGRVRITTEMRGSRPPDPFDLTLTDGPGPSVHWEVSSGTAPGSGRESVARVLLRKAGEAGMTSEALRKALGMRDKDVKPLVEGIGGQRKGQRGPWCLPSPGHGEQAVDEAAPGSEVEQSSQPPED